MSGIGSSAGLIDVIGKPLSVAAFRVGQALQCVTDGPPCKCWQHGSKLLKLCKFCLQLFWHPGGANAMAFPINAGHPLIMKEGVVAVRRSRERPLNTEVITEANEKYALPLLRDTIVRSIH
ncbi:hypothetical protein D3C71_883520 [compost metagenome]